VLDYMGPWPWYIVGMCILGIVVCMVLYLPFARGAQQLGVAET
jgi:uncharacterized membrane protein YwaF